MRMFDLQSGDELSFVINSNNPQQEVHKLSFDDPILFDQPFHGCNIYNPSTATAKSAAATATKKERFIEFGVQQSKTEKKKELNVKKSSRRDIERRRRLEMANLYSSLRNLLPLECIKGKRSICEDMQEAVNYIKEKKKNNLELKIRRDKLKKLTDISDEVKNSVTVNVEKNGVVEILVSASFEYPRFRISSVFVELMERGLNVVNWVSTKANGKFFHKIQAEASREAYHDPSVLQERLVYVINKS